MKRTLGLVLMSVVLSGASLAQAASDPSLAEVNAAVRAGHLDEAQSMMQTVLRDHPNSAKAHFVEAEVLARLSRIGEAQSELNRAETIEPGLVSIPPATVQDLRSRIAAGAVRPAVRSESPSSGFPWGPVLLIGGAGLLVFLVLRARRPVVVMPAGGPNVIGGPGAGPVYGGGMPYGAPMGGGGIGSGILGGLATGAAVGAGMVAGEALAHEFIGNHEADRASNSWGDDGSRIASADTSDLGVSGGWDSGGSDIAGGSGGDDWS